MASWSRLKPSLGAGAGEHNNASLEKETGGGCLPTDRVGQMMAHLIVKISACISY